MKTRLLVLVALSLPGMCADAGPLKIVNVNFPAIHCLFNTNCTITVKDSEASFNITNALTTGFLQSRTYKALPGTPAYSLNGYMYRLGLDNIPRGATNHSVTINTLELNFGSLSNFTYNGQSLGCNGGRRGQRCARLRLATGLQGDHQVQSAACPFRRFPARGQHLFFWHNGARGADQFDGDNHRFSDADIRRSLPAQPDSAGAYALTPGRLAIAPGHASVSLARVWLLNPFANSSTSSIALAS
jgi:hypothetical protein